MNNAMRTYLWIPLVMLLFVAATPTHDVPADPPLTTTYKSDTAHSLFGFKVRHLGIANVRGTFNEFDATVTMDGTDLSTIMATATAQVASIDTGIERRDNHLRSDDFFNAEAYPTMTFESTEVRNIDGDEFELVGNLTIRDVTMEVVFEAEYLGSGMMRDTKKVGFSASASIDRFDYNLKWDNAADGVLIVDDTIKIEIELEMNAEA